jgi:hypothetical protein
MASRKPKLVAQAPAIIRRRTLKVLGTFISLLEAVWVRASSDWSEPLRLDPGPLKN